MEQRVKNAISVFIKAIDKRTLAKGTCVACAVGNLVAAGMGEEVYRDLSLHPTDSGYYKCKKNNRDWSWYFSTGLNGKQGIDIDYEDNEGVISNISSTDFSAEELMKIEYAFETNSEIYFNEYINYSDKEIRDDQTKGLEAVIETMLSFSNDTETDVKEVFTNKVKKEA